MNEQAILDQRDLMIAMRDGVRLATDLFLPADAAPGSLPAIVERTPYGKDFVARAKELRARHVPAGYAVLVQDVRGRYGSEGEWRPFADDGADAADLFAWIAAQPWSNGKVGMVGTSYCGGTQHASALAGAPHLTAVVPVDAMSNPGRFGIRYGRAFELRWLNWIATLGVPNAAAPEKSRDPATDRRAHAAAVARACPDPAGREALAALPPRVREIAADLPALPKALDGAPHYRAWLAEALAHVTEDAFWADGGLGVVAHTEAYADIPGLHVTGAYDSWGGSVADLTFACLRRAKTSPQRLILGPWTHGAQDVSYAGQAEFGPAAAIDLRALERRWFDRWLKGIENGTERDPPVRVFVMGGGDGRRTAEGRVFVGGEWRDFDAWPPRQAVQTPFFLGPGGRLATAPAPCGEATYRFDPADPTPALGGPVSSQGPLLDAGAWEQGPLDGRADVLRFVTEPLEESLEIVGSPMARLWVVSDGPAMDFTAKLVDVWPSGVALNIGDGIVRASGLDAGAPHELTIHLYPTALRFERGHRIRLDVASSNFPRFDLNAEAKAGANRILHGPDHPSRLLLPVLRSAV